METEQELFELLQIDQYRMVAEAEVLALVHQHEKGFLMDKGKKRAYALGWFYGDPTCGIVDSQNQWAIMAGTDQFVLWDNGEVIPLSFNNAHQMKLDSPNSILILTDPWTEYSAIWSLDVQSRQFEKMKDFPEYREREYTEDIIW
ncbi:hypothetical protein [Chitinophaga filiformis]|uniref:Uncharacterized protein n=1 Tax=Chitinophaga filiformis TaxID=104663 RepID=A0A1G7MEG0_CHIFI|nr:hypothetical protein [Chitinophaga filiformis]SDF60198.1 hypothetical protein SAMN04488121_102396 [Chitinophaga filiformis]